MLHINIVLRNCGNGVCKGYKSNNLQLMVTEKGSKTQRMHIIMSIIKHSILSSMDNPSNKSDHLL